MPAWCMRKAHRLNVEQFEGVPGHRNIFITGISRHQALFKEDMFMSRGFFS